MYPDRANLILLYYERRPGSAYLGILDRGSRRIVTAFGGTPAEASAAAADYLGLTVPELVPFLVVRHDGSERAEEAEEIVGEHRAEGWDFIKNDEEYYAQDRVRIERRGW